MALRGFLRRQERRAAVEAASTFPPVKRNLCDPAITAAATFVAQPSQGGAGMREQADKIRKREHDHACSCR
jgi:hypothetical protein